MSGNTCECCGGPTGDDGVEYAVEITQYEPATEYYRQDERRMICPRCYGHISSALGVEPRSNEAAGR